MTTDQQKIIEYMKKNVITLSENSTKASYRALVESVYEFMRRGFEVKEIRNGIILFRFNKDSKVYPIQLNHLITTLYMWEPIIRLERAEDIDETYFIDCANISSSSIKEFFDDKVIYPYQDKITNRKMNKVLHDAVYNLGRISADFNVLMGLSINIETFMDVARKNPRFDEILRTKVDPHGQPKDVEQELLNLTDEQIAIMSQEDNFLQPIFRSGTGIKSGQFKEFAVSGGYKPDLQGNTMPIPVNSNFVVGGLQGATNYYIDSIGGRKSIIMNATVMGTSGHFTRLILLLSSETRMSDVDDCGTLHGIRVEIKSKTHLKKLKGRWYREPHQRQYQLINHKDDTLIGKTVVIRSPMTCAGDDVCHKCYGNLHHVNSDLQSVGSYSATKLSEPVSQSILSSKHLLTTDSSKIEFDNPLFDKLFSIFANEIVVSNDDIIDNYSILFIKGNINKIDEFDDDEYNEFVNIFHVRNNKTGEITEFIDKENKDMFLSPELKAEMYEKSYREKKDVIAIPLYDARDIGRLFVLQVENNELTRPLYDIIDLLDNAKKREESGVITMDDMVQRMLDLMIISKIKAHSIHAEVIMRALIRSKHDVLERPNFRRYDGIKDVQLMTIKSALDKHPSVTISLSFQAINRQLSSPLTFKKRKSSFLDPFFKKEL